MVTSTPRPMQLILIVFHNYLCNIWLRTLPGEVVRYRGGRGLDKPWPAVDRSVIIMIRLGWLTDDAPGLYPSVGDRYPPPRNSRRGTTMVGNDGAGAQVRRGDDPRAIHNPPLRPC